MPIQTTVMSHFLLRFGTGGAETACILVDAGDGVDLDSLLSPSDKLVAICLTHAHVDHYAELTAAHRGDVPNIHVSGHSDHLG